MIQQRKNDDDFAQNMDGLTFPLGSVTLLKHTGDSYVSGGGDGDGNDLDRDFPDQAPGFSVECGVTYAGIAREGFEPHSP